MSLRDEGATHYFGDDCPGGHRAANVAGVDWDDQLTADEANEGDAAAELPQPAAGAPEGGDVYRALASAQAARWSYVYTLDPQAYAAYIDKRSQDPNLRADVDTVIALVRAQVAAEYAAQVADALQRLDGSPASAVALLTGMSHDEIEKLGGVSDGQ